MDPSSKRRSIISTFPNLPAIPEDIIIDILLRLAVKTLLRFKSVCKTWNNVINTPSFKSMHHNFGDVSQLLIYRKGRSQKKSYHYVFSLRSNDESSSVFSPDIEVYPSPFSYILRVIGSCHGIVCYACHAHDYIRSSIFLSNPAMREIKELPPPPPATCVLGLAFGFDSSNIYDYKVLRMLRYSNASRIRAEMFTLSSNTWREIDFGFKYYIESFGRERKGLFCANSFYFKVEVRNYKGKSGVILCCDIHNEMFKTMDFPPTLIYKDYIVRLRSQLMVYKKFLSLLEYEENSLHIWMMKDHGVVESWTKLYTIGPSELYTRPSLFGFFPWRAICFWMEDEALLLLKENKLVSCQLNSMDIKQIKKYGFKYSEEVVVYKESLFSII